MYSFFEYYFKEYSFDKTETAVCCPFPHTTPTGFKYQETNPSAHINLEKGLFHCKVCDKGLSETSFISEILGCSYESAIKIGKLFTNKEDINTWDNDLEHHYFNHALMLPHEMKFEKEKFYETDVSIFDVQSSAMFLEKINKLPNALNYFLEVLKQIDFHYYEYLRKKYDFDVHDLSPLLA